MDIAQITRTRPSEDIRGDRCGYTPRGLLGPPSLTKEIGLSKRGNSVFARGCVWGSVPSGIRDAPGGLAEREDQVEDHADSEEHHEGDEDTHRHAGAGGA